MIKLTYEFVKSVFVKEGYELISTEYINSRSNLLYKCKNCKTICNTTYARFSRGKRCIKCVGLKKYTYEYVKNYFEEKKCELLETNYKDCQSVMKYKCKCGDESTTRFITFKNGSINCNRCAHVKYNIEEVKNYFIEQGCKLLEDKYINLETKMKFRCKCNNESEISFTRFKLAKNCNKCGWKKGHENSKKNAKIYKDYIYPSGRIDRIQGYENLALDELIKIYKENDIFTNRQYMPKITYYFKGKYFRYYPDIYIKSENRIIEIKSDFTYKMHLIKNILKSLSSKKLGYNFEFWIYTPEKKLYNKLII